MILFAHLRHTKNVGDLACTPYHYFSLPGKKLADINSDLPESDAVIFGGGAIEYTMAGEKGVQHRVKAKRKIAWGVGSSAHGKKTHPAPPKGLDLTGIREYGREGGTYVPCVTCMLPFFDNVPAPETDVVTFFNADSKIAKPEIGDFPTLENVSSLQETLSFLARGETVITNSYHGAYWATLMGRKVVCFPYSSKFYGYKCPPIMSDKDSWQEALPQARAYSEYRDDCRYENLQFFKKVTDLVF